MMVTNTNTIKKRYQAFEDVAGDYLHIHNTRYYQQTLTLLEELFEKAEDKAQDPLNGLIELLSRAVADYEDRKKELKLFERSANVGPADVATLRLIMEQQDLGVADFPEIGDKSLISKILSGERNLTKLHIQKLSKRFKINPALFF